MNKPTQRVVSVERQPRDAVAAPGWNRPLPRWVVWLLCILAVLAALIVLPHIGSLHVYQKHFRSNAPELRLRFEELSPQMDEAALREHFKGVSLWCMTEQQSALGNRVCYTALGKANGNPALGLALFLRDGRLRFAVLDVPWWAHARVQSSYNRDWGTPVAAGTDGSGTRLLRWKLPSGRLEMNGTRYFGPLNYSVVLWTAGG